MHFPGLDIIVYFVHQAHSNESVGSIRHKVAQKLKLSPDTVQIVANDKMVSIPTYQLGASDSLTPTTRGSTDVDMVIMFPATGRCYSCPLLKALHSRYTVSLVWDLLFLPLHW